MDEHKEGEVEESLESTEGDNPLNAIDRLVEHFLVPLEAAAVDAFEICGEFQAMITYTTRFISLSTM